MTDHLDQECPHCHYPEHATAIQSIAIAFDVGDIRRLDLPVRVCGRCERVWLDDVADQIIERTHRGDK